MLFRSRDARYAAIALSSGAQFDAQVSCVVAMWPVICPLTRYRENLQRTSTGDGYYATRVGAGLDQMKYWLTEEAMGDGSPMLALERGDTNVTFRPEGTAPVVRAYLEHNLDKIRPFQKFWYGGPMFRFERPQSGRLRQHHQFGAESFGIAEPEADVECILLQVKMKIQ